MSYIARGWNATTPTYIPTRIEDHVNFQTVAVSDGQIVNDGPAEATLIAETLELDEVWPILQLLNINMFAPSAKCTVWLPDSFGILTRFNGYVELDTQRTNMTWRDEFRLKLTRLERIT